MGNILGRTGVCFVLWYEVQYTCIGTIAAEPTVGKGTGDMGESGTEGEQG